MKTGAGKKKIIYMGEKRGEKDKDKLPGTPAWDGRIQE